MIGFPGRKTKKIDVEQHIDASRVTPSLLAKRFVLEKQQKIIKSGVRNLFTPTHPIKDVEALLGREEEVQRVYDAIHTPGRHVLVYGDRGVGKSSLAYIMGLLAKDNYEVIIKRCDSKSDFIDIASKPLFDLLNIDLSVVETHKHFATEGGIKIGLGAAQIGGGVLSGEGRVSEGLYRQAQSPSWVASKLAPEKALYIIDELDLIHADGDRRQIAELLKLISDNQVSNFKCLLVGIAQTGSDLTAGHPSVQRCLIEIPVKRLTEAQLIEIIERAEPKLTFKFSPEAKSEIAKLSHGYPYFTHLLALKAAEEAIVHDYHVVKIEHIEHARHLAVYDADGMLRNAYKAALKDDTNNKYKRILQAAANATSDVITASQLSQSYRELFGEEISLSSYVQRLVSEGTDSVFRRVGSDKAVYRFNDPRMPSYIRLAQGVNID